MRFSPKLLLVVALLAPASGGALAAPREFLRVDSLTFNGEEQTFYFKGRAKLPDGTRILCILTMNSHAARSSYVFVLNRKFHGQFQPGEKEDRKEEVLPGVYKLEAVLLTKGQILDVIKKLGPDFKVEVASKTCTVGSAPQGKAKAEKLLAGALAEVRKMRILFDELVQHGYDTTARAERYVKNSVDKQLSPEHRNEIKKLWGAVFNRKDIENLDESFRRNFKERYVVTPFQSAIEHLANLMELTVRLKHSFTVILATQCNFKIPPQVADSGRFGPPDVIAEIVGSSWKAEKMFKKDGFKLLKPIWEPAIDLPAESGSMGGDRYVSSTSGFKIKRASKFWLLKKGEAFSPVRLTFEKQAFKGIVHAVLQVQVVRFPWARTIDEKVKAWERLAHYEWPGFVKKSGKMIEDKEKGTRYYRFEFLTAGKDLSTTVVCHLHFPGGKRQNLIYGILQVEVIPAIEHEGLPVEFKKMQESFKFD